MFLQEKSPDSNQLRAEFTEKGANKPLYPRFLALTSHSHSLCYVKRNKHFIITCLEFSTQNQYQYSPQCTECTLTLNNCDYHEEIDVNGTKETVKIQRD